MGAIRIILGGVLLVAAAPVCAQSVQEPRLTYSKPISETRTTLDERGKGLWLRAATVVRGESEPGATDGRTAYKISLQKEILGHTWIGVVGYTQLPRFDPMRGEMRGTRGAIGPKLSFEAGDEIELGISWMKRKRRGAPPPGPRAYVAFHF